MKNTLFIVSLSCCLFACQTDSEDLTDTLLQEKLAQYTADYRTTLPSLTELKERHGDRTEKIVNNMEQVYKKKETLHSFEKLTARLGLTLQAFEELRQYTDFNNGFAFHLSMIDDKEFKGKDQVQKYLQKYWYNKTEEDRFLTMTLKEIYLHGCQAYRKKEQARVYYDYELTLATPSAWHTFELYAHDYILDITLMEGISVPICSDRMGASTTCVMRQMYGPSVSQFDQSVLDDIEMDKGYLTPCVAYATGDMAAYTHVEQELY
ncbi:MAG: hypothetical protein ACFB0B_01030 [Thermonemataceae bacterium]